MMRTAGAHHNYVYIPRIMAEGYHNSLGWGTWIDESGWRLAGAKRGLEVGG